MKNIFCICLLLLFISHKTFAGSIEDFNQHFALMPQPQRIELLTGKGVVYNEIRSIGLTNIQERPVMPALLSDLPIATAASAGSVSLILEKNLSLPSPEGYVLEIKDKAITIKASEQSGIFYGLQTLQQLLEDAHDQLIEIPACRITDYPEIAYRAVHLDMKHHIETGKYYYDMIDRLAAVKVNAIIVECEDKLRYRKAPLVGANDALSIEEFAALSRYAKARFIEISPLVQGLGHASFILKHEEYKDLRDDSTSDWAFDPLNPKTYDLQFALYEDAIAATPYGKYLHVGGDEVGALGKSELCKKSGMKPFELQMYWLKKVTDFALAHNRIPIFWDDMVFKLSHLYETTYDTSINSEKVNQLWKENEHLLNERLPLFPKQCVFMRWNYDAPRIPGDIKAIDWYNANKLPVMAATAAQTMWAMLPRNRSNFQSIKDFCQLTSEKKMSGILCTMWDDCSPHFETYWRGIYDFAFLSWNYEDKPVEAVHNCFRRRFYAAQLSDASTDFQDMLEDALTFWETALLKDGDRYNYHKTFDLVDLPEKNNPGTWSTTYAKKLSDAVSVVKMYNTIKERIANAMQQARRNQYALQVMNQINELQVYLARLLLLLEEYEKATAQNKQQAAAQIKNYVNGFDTLRTRFENVYAKTRILGNPPGYQLDMNIHEHLANGTNNTDWMFMYELPINKKINDWLLSVAN